MIRNRNSWLVTFGRRLSRGRFLISRLVEKLLIYINSKNQEPKIIFILGLPRGGTTLTFQCFCHSLKVQYLSNFYHLFHKIPLISSLLNYKLCARYSSDFTSNEGFTNGISGPAEGYNFWKYWTGTDIIESKNDIIVRSKLHHLKSALSFKSRPFVTCYLGHSLDVNKLVNNFPNAIFVRVKRNKTDNAISLLNCRLKSGNVNNWFSVLPEGGSSLKNDSPYLQIVRQINIIDSSISLISSNNRMFNINYEELCNNPNKIMGEFVSHANKFDYNIELKSPLPISFNVKCNSDNKFKSLFDELFTQESM